MQAQIFASQAASHRWAARNFATGSHLHLSIGSTWMANKMKVPSELVVQHHLKPTLNCGWNGLSLCNGNCNYMFKIKLFYSPLLGLIWSAGLLLWEQGVMHSSLAVQVGCSVRTGPWWAVSHHPHRCHLYHPMLLHAYWLEVKLKISIKSHSLDYKSFLICCLQTLNF